MSIATEMKFDLHCHSTFSDGELSPEALMELAQQVGISHIALTDHDTLNGLADARQAAKDRSIEFIDGVELSCNWNHQLLHIVALGIDPSNATLKAGIELNTQLRRMRAQAMIEDFSKHGIELQSEVEGLLGKAAPTRPHFAQALINLGYAKDKKQAFKRYLVRGKPGFIAMQWPSIDEIGSWVSAAGGIAVLAHPLRYKFTRAKLVKLIGEMKAAGIRGIEVATSINDPQQIKMLADLASQHKLLASTGSDFHSPDQPWARLGSAPPLPQTVTPVWTELVLSALPN